MSLYDLFVNDKNKPKKNIQTYLSQHKKKQFPNLTKALMPSQKKTDPRTPLEKMKMTPVKKPSKKNSSNGFGTGDSGGSSQSGNLGGSQSSDSSSKNKNHQKWSKSIRTYISNMPDSNVSFNYKNDDIWNRIAVNRQTDVWKMKEEVFLYTFHDKQIHKYIGSITIDMDKSEIMSTCEISTPFDKRLMEYWIPSKTTFAIIGGTYDREILFVGRVSEINQVGGQISIVGQNIGWKFKPYMDKKFEKGLEGLTVKEAVKAIFKEVGLDKGRYYINLNGIPALDKYKLGEDLAVEKNGQQILNVPELKSVIKNLNDYKDVNLDTRGTQRVADDYDKKKGMMAVDRVISSGNYYYPTSLRKNYGVKTDIKNNEIIYEPVLDKIQRKNGKKVNEVLTYGYSKNGEHTYEEVLTSIASAIDAHFFIIDTTVCFISFNALVTSPIIQKADTPEIEFWQMKDDSFELDMNQYGFYNTVHIKYKNGIVTKSYDDLVRMFGEIAITYKEPKLDYDGAMTKAQAYLSAHVRDFGMEIKTTILHSGKIVPSTFIKLKNPQTMSENLYFVQGASIQWSSDSDVLSSDLSLRFGPENPDNLEIPETGTAYKSGGTNQNVSADVEKAANEICGGSLSQDECAEKIYGFFVDNARYRLYSDSQHSVTQTLQKTPSNCFDTSTAAYELFTAKGIRTQFWHGTLITRSATYGHYWLKIMYKGNWEVVDLGRGNKAGIGQFNGRLVNGRIEKKNY